MTSTAQYKCSKCGKIFDGDALLVYREHKKTCALSSSSRILKFEELKPIDEFHVLRALPGGMFLVNPTEIEEQICQIFIEEIKKYERRD
jgi:DNA-directed RNA polymerase subunit RPC12/RpoP